MASQPPGASWVFFKIKKFYEIFAFIVLVHRIEEILGQLSAPSPFMEEAERGLTIY